MNVMEEKQPFWQKLIAPSIVLVLVVPMGFMLRARLVEGSGMETRHRAFLESYVTDLRAGRAARPGPEADGSIALLSRAASWEVRDVRWGIGFDGTGDSCWSIEIVSAAGDRAALVLGVSDDDGPIHVAGWGMQPKCRCPTGRTAAGSLRC